MTASFSGKLVDLSPLDVLQFLHISQRSGVVRFEHRGHGSVSFALRNGRIVSAASSMRELNVGRILKERFGITESCIEKALARQRTPEGQGKPLGALLVELGDLTQEQVEQGVVGLIERLVQTVLTWEHGAFEFQLGVVEQIDNVAHFPARLCEESEVDVQHLLMEAVKIFDEMGKGRQETQPSCAAPTTARVDGSLSEPFSLPPIPPVPSLCASPSSDAVETTKTSSESPPNPVNQSREPTPHQAPIPASDVPAPPQRATPALPTTLIGDASDAGAEEIDKAVEQLPTEGWIGLRGRAVIVITGDALLKATLAERCKQEGWALEAYGVVQQARRALTRLCHEDHDVLILGDLKVTTPGNFSRLGSYPGLRRLRDEFPRLPIFLFAESVSASDAAVALRQGARRVFDRPARGSDPKTFKDRVEVFVDEVVATLHGAFCELQAAQTNNNVVWDELRSLRDRVLNLRRTDARMNISLAVLEHVAQSLERAVLFLCRDTDLLGIGAFGDGPDGQALTKLVVGRELPLKDLPLVSRCIATGEPYEGDLSGEAGFAALFSHIEAPETGAGLVLPITAMGRVAAIVYGDNGRVWRPLISSYGLEILTCQAGLMLENVFLRKAWERRSDKH